MITKNYNYKVLLKWTFSAIIDEKSRAVDGSVNLKRFRKRLAKKMSEIQNLTQEEYKFVYDTLVRGAKKIAAQANLEGKKNGIIPYKTFDEMYGNCRKVWLGVRQRTKIKRVRAQLKEGIFFMCSKHYPVAKDHADYQGRLYVHQGWRNLVQGKEYRSVSEYVKSNKILTLQSVMKNPPYLITRPNCRHKLVTVPTQTVISGDNLDKFRINSHSKKMYSREDYYDFRGDVYAAVQGIIENKKARN